MRLCRWIHLCPGEENDKGDDKKNDDDSKTSTSSFDDVSRTSTSSFDDDKHYDPPSGEDPNQIDTPQCDKKVKELNKTMTVTCKADLRKLNQSIRDPVKLYNRYLLEKCKNSYDA